MRISLDYLPDSTVLVIEDPFRARHVHPGRARVGGGYGLAGMRERAELLGGELLASPTNSGFRVELRVPATGVRPRLLDTA